MRAPLATAACVAALLAPSACRRETSRPPDARAPSAAAPNAPDAGDGGAAMASPRFRLQGVGARWSHTVVPPAPPAPAPPNPPRADAAQPEPSP